MERQPINAARVSARSLVQTGSLVDLVIIGRLHTDTFENIVLQSYGFRLQFMYDNVAPSFANLTRFMITQIPYHYASIPTNIITYVTTW